MIWLNELLSKWSCRHEWQEINKTQVYDGNKFDLPVEISITYICKKCGKFKKIKL